LELWLRSFTAGGGCSPCVSNIVAANTFSKLEAIASSRSMIRVSGLTFATTRLLRRHTEGSGPRRVLNRIPCEYMCRRKRVAKANCTEMDARRYPPLCRSIRVAVRAASTAPSRDNFDAVGSGAVARASRRCAGRAYSKASENVARSLRHIRDH
jgi:hypothetical protein